MPGSASETCRRPASRAEATAMPGAATAGDFDAACGRTCRRFFIVRDSTLGPGGAGRREGGHACWVPPPAATFGGRRTGRAAWPSSGLASHAPSRNPLALRTEEHLLVRPLQSTCPEVRAAIRGRRNG